VYIDVFFCSFQITSARCRKLLI